MEGASLHAHGHYDSKANIASANTLGEMGQLSGFSVLTRLISGNQEAVEPVGGNAMAHQE